MEHLARPPVVTLSDPRATDASLVGAKAANLALARAAGLPTLPAAVLTTAWTGPLDRGRRRRMAHRVRHGTSPVVVRSSSTGEDGDASSMAGVFESVLDVSGEAALARRRRGGPGVRGPSVLAGLVDAAMAVLVQPMLRRRMGRCAVRC